MKRHCLLILICVLAFIFLSPSSIASLSKHIVNYQIKAELVPDEKVILGSETLIWLNDSEEFISELHFHLYLNAFKNTLSSFFKESRGSHRGFKADMENWGYIDVEKIQIKDGADLTPTMEYIQPDDGNEDDQTVMKVTLPEPIPPQGTITLDIEFYSKLPKVFARSGFYEDFFMVGQWFPKIGVLWNGEWNCHQYHLNSEFFADYGVYKVEITAPEEFVVGATGKRIEELENDNGTKTYIHYQEDIHDFAWTACPDFVEHREQFVMEDPYVDTEMILLIHRTHLNHKERYLSALKHAIEFYSQNYGPYPYPTITLVDPVPGAFGAGGMEYPTLFTGMTFWWLPEGLRMAEMVTIHEFGHNYWYGIIGSNEFEEAWLDEGINSYSEAKAMAGHYGEEGSMIDLWGMKVSNNVMQRAQIIGMSRLDPVVKKSWEFYNFGTYGGNSYMKASLVLLTLENFLGEEVMKKIMKTYFERWKFRHPTSKDFMAVVEEVSGQELSWFFDQFLYSPDKLDYAIRKIESREVKEPEGILDDMEKEPEGEDVEDTGEDIEAEDEKEAEKENEEDKEIEKGEEDDEGESGEDEEEVEIEKVYKSEVVIVRKGELFFPQEILIVFENGEEVWEKWDGKERWKRFIYYRPHKIKSAQVDPEYKILLDVNYKNNSLIRKPNRTFPLKCAMRLMCAFQTILSFISF